MRQRRLTQHKRLVLFRALTQIFASQKFPLYWKR